MSRNDNQKQTLHRFLDSVGDGSGTKNAIGDYSVSPLTLFIQPPSKVLYQINRLLVSLEGTGFRWTRYGSIVGGLANGIELKKVNDSTTLVDLTDGVVVQTCGDWSLNCYDAEIRTDPGGGDLFQLRWSFWKTGQYITLNGDTNERLEIVLNDNFSTLTHHQIKVEGWVN